MRTALATLAPPTELRGRLYGGSSVAAVERAGAQLAGNGRAAADTVVETEAVRAAMSVSPSPGSPRPCVFFPRCGTAEGIELLGAAVASTVAHAVSEVTSAS